jgi:aminopeptidase YwaD
MGEGVGRFDSGAIRRHLEVLTGEVGVRVAGSTAERRAAAYVAAELERRGAAVAIEEFPVRERVVAAQRLEVLAGGAWRRFPCSLLSNAPGTDGRVLEAPIALIDAATGYQREDLSDLRGKAVVHLGTHIESAGQYRRLMEAGPAFLLFVDVRYPADVATADGMFPAYVHHHGAVPTVSVAYQHAWSWKVDGAEAARLCVQGGMRDSRSQNVIGDLPGSDPSAGTIYVGAHHDTQADSVGADDNGTGVAALLALAGALAGAPRRRTVRLVSFGAEEQLSVGSAAYVRRHRDDLAAQGRFMFNLDTLGSHLGWTTLVCNGPEGIVPVFVEALKARGQYVKVTRELIPYADHFPFVAAGVPAAWMGRENCAAGRFFHHRPDDDMTRVSCELVAELAAGVGAALDRLATAEVLPFPSHIDEADRPAVAAMWNELFGGWEGFTGGYR